MKQISYFLTCTALFLFISCDNDSDSEEPTIVTTTDLAFQVEEDTEVGTVIGELSGTSNRGSVTFTIASQTPTGAVVIGGDTMSSLVIADASAFDVNLNPEILVTVNVSKGDVTKQSAITITVNPSCPEVDLSVFATTLNIQLGIDGVLDIPLGSNFEGVAGECGVLTISGPDPLFAPDDDDVIEFRFFPSKDDNPNTGVVTMDFVYGRRDGRGQFVGSGEYNFETGVIRLVYDITYFSDGVEEKNNLIEINVATNSGLPDADTDPDGDEEPFECSPDIDLSAFNTTELSVASGEFDMDFIPQIIDLGSDFTGEVTDCIFTISGDDIFGLSCPEAMGQSFEFVFSPSLDFETSAVIPGEFLASIPEVDYGCDNIVGFNFGAFYTQGSNKIDISWIYNDENGNVIAGVAIITAPE